jgi:site-specific DNA-adenine methylase
MKKNHFFIPYYGNKRQEVEKIYNEIKEDIESNKYKFIIEPFCGSGAFSYYVWLNNKDRDLTYILNDNNKIIMELYCISKDETKFNNLYNDIIKLHEETTSKEKYLEVCKKSNTDITSYIYVNKVYNIRPGLYPSTKNFTTDSWNVFKNAPIIDFVRNAKISFTNLDALDVYNNYKNNDKALIFLDPPYLASENSWYKDPKVNIYEYLFNNDIIKEKALILLCLENNWIIKLLFNGKQHIIYDKKYEASKKKTEHILIINKKELKN